MFTVLLRSIAQKCKTFLSGVVATSAVFSFTYPLESALMVFSDYQKHRILYYQRLRKNYAEIARRWTEEGRRATKVSILKVSSMIQTNRDSLSQARDRKGLENDRQREANQRGTNEQGRWDNWMRIAKLTLQSWHHRLRKNSPEVEAAAGLDIERHQLLPNDPGSEQGKATSMGNQE